MTQQRKVPLTVFGQPVPEWYRDILLRDSGFHSAVAKQIDDFYQTLVEASNVSFTDIDAKIAYALTTQYPLDKRAEAAFIVVILHSTIGIYHRRREVADRVGGRLLELIHAHPTTTYKFYTQILVAPSKMNYARMLGMKNSVAEEYLQYAALYGTVYPDQAFATYEDTSNAVQHV